METCLRIKFVYDFLYEFKPQFALTSVFMATVRIKSLLHYETDVLLS